MDNKTRFLLAIQTKKVSRAKDPRGIIQKAKAAISQKSNFVATDKGKFHIRAIRHEFPAPAHNFVLYNKVGINHITNKVDNQLICRYHVTFSECDKVIGGVKSEKTAQRYGLVNASQAINALL